MVIRYKSFFEWISRHSAIFLADNRSKPLRLYFFSKIKPSQDQTPTHNISTLAAEGAPYFSNTY